MRSVNISGYSASNKGGSTVKKIKISVVFLLFLVAFAGCGEKKRDLTVYTYSSFPVALIEKVKEHFKEEEQVTVEFRSFSDTGPLYNQLVQEKKKPVADLVIGLDNNYFTRIVREDLLRPYRPKVADRIREDLIFDPKFRLTPFDYGHVLFNYDSEKLGRVPTTHQELTDPYYRGKIILQNPLTSSPGQVFLLTTVALFWGRWLSGLLEGAEREPFGHHSRVG